MPNLKGEIPDFNRGDTGITTCQFYRHGRHIRGTPSLCLRTMTWRRIQDVQTEFKSFKWPALHVVKSHYLLSYSFFVIVSEWWR